MHLGQVLFTAKEGTRYLSEVKGMGRSAGRPSPMQFLGMLIWARTCAQHAFAAKMPWTDEPARQRSRAPATRPVMCKCDVGCHKPRNEARYSARAHGYQNNAYGLWADGRLHGYGAQAMDGSTGVPKPQTPGDVVVIVRSPMSPLKTWPARIHTN